MRWEAIPKGGNALQGRLSRSHEAQRGERHLSRLHNVRGSRQSFRTARMSTTQLTIALAIAALINQWLIAIFSKRKTAIPKTKPVSSVAAKAKRSLRRRQYVALGADLVLLIFGIYALWYIMSQGDPDLTPSLQISVQISVAVSFSAIVIAYQAHRVLCGVMELFFP